MGGLVTWLKFCLKKLERGLNLLDKTAIGVSSPIEPIASFWSATIGCNMLSKSSMVKPAKNCLSLKSDPSNECFSLISFKVLLNST